jgi:agmatine deiminase
MPAEWEPHEAVWLCWPHNPDDWPGKIASIHFVYAEIARRIAESEKVRIIVNDAGHEAKATSVLKRSNVSLEQIEFFHVPSNRGWTRDTGPIFVRTACVSGRPVTEPQISVAGFKFDGWAKYADHDLDTKIAKTLAKRLKKEYKQVKHNNRHFVLEGGAIDVNGRGSLLTTEECLLDPLVQVRNPGVTRAEYENILAEHLGATNVIWLGKGIAGDDTHGHVDDLCRFVDKKTVVLCREKNSSDENYELLEENRERLEEARLENGSKVAVEFLPMPEPVIYRGQRLPASYANFLITNSSVLVPTFNDPSDRIALGILADLFPKRRIVGIHALDLVWGLGTIHCLSQQQPL